MVEICNICIDEMVNQPLITTCGCKNYICDRCIDIYKNKLGNKCLFNCNSKEIKLSEFQEAIYDFIHYVYYNGIDL